MAYDVYILASGQQGTLFIGVTNDIIRRAWKRRLIERVYPECDTLYDPLNGQCNGARGLAPGRQWCVSGRCDIPDMCERKAAKSVSAPISSNAIDTTFDSCLLIHEHDNKPDSRHT